VSWFLPRLPSFTPRSDRLVFIFYTPVRERDSCWMSLALYLFLPLLLLTRTITATEDPSAHRAWWGRRERSMREDSGEDNAGRYRLPPDAAAQLRAALRDVHAVDLRRRVRELVTFHATHQEKSESQSTREAFEDAQERWDAEHPVEDTSARVVEGTQANADALLLTPPRRRLQSNLKPTSYNSIVRRKVVVRVPFDHR
jgi:hypothetical protein